MFFSFSEQPAIRLPDTKRVMMLAFNCASPKASTTIESMTELKALTQLTLYLVDKVKRFRLSKEGKQLSLEF